MKKEDKEHIKEEISAIQDRLNKLAQQLDEEPEETEAPAAAHEIKDEDIPVVYIDTSKKATDA
jgi:hypothetical protein